MKGPLVSVIVPARNEAARLGTLLDALTAQTLARDDFEVIVIDNGSGDATAERAREGGATVVACHDVLNADAARNRGVARSRGAILAFIDADCVPEARWLQAGCDALARADLAAGMITFFDHESGPARRYDALANLDQGFNATRRGVAFTANLFVKREVMDRLGPFPPFCGGDFAFTLAATRAGFTLIHAPEAVVKHPARTCRALAGKAWRIGREKAHLAQAGTDPLRVPPPKHQGLLHPLAFHAAYGRLFRDGTAARPWVWIPAYAMGWLYVAMGAMSFAWHRARLALRNGWDVRPRIAALKDPK